MAFLRQISFDGLVGVGAVASCIGVSEPWNGVEVACFDGLEPGLFDWKANAGV